MMSICPSIGDVNFDGLLRWDFEIFKMKFTGIRLLPGLLP